MDGPGRRRLVGRGRQGPGADGATSSRGRSSRHEPGDSGPGRDLYLFLSQLQDDGLARISVFVNPLVTWIWVAGGIMLIGGLIAGWPGPPATRREPAPARAGTDADVPV